MMEKKLANSLTVLMAVYDGETPVHLDLALQSLSDQTLQEFSIVLVKDGPLRRELEEVVDGWQQKLTTRLSTYSLECCQGLAVALQVGLGHVHSEWVARFDSDDYCVPTRLEKQMHHLQQNPTIDVLSSWMGEFQKNPYQVERIKKVALGENIKKYFAWRNPINHPAVVMRRSIIVEAGGYRSQFFRLEDYDLWARVLAKGGVLANLPQVLVHQRIGSGLVDRRGGWKQFCSEMRFRCYLRHLGLSSLSLLGVSLLAQLVLRLSPIFLRRRLWQVSRAKLT